MADAVPATENLGTPPATPGASTPESTPNVQAASTVQAPVIPEKYEFKLAEGRAIDEGLISAVSPVLKELGLTQESATKLVEAYDKYGQAFEAAQEKQFQEFIADNDRKNVDAMKKEWGPDYPSKLNVAQRGIARFLSDAGKQKLNDSGLGNDPEFMRAFYQAGKMIQEDQPATGLPANSKPVTIAQALYGNA